jgi:hypothetical protein
MQDLLQAFKDTGAIKGLELQAGALYQGDNMHVDLGISEKSGRR